MEILASGRFVRLVSREGWECVERVNTSGIVCMVPVTEENEVVLVEQFRRPLGVRVIEWPAGLVGDNDQTQGEALETAARRELLEETGYEAKEFVYLTEGPPSSGLTSEVITFYLAKGLKKVADGGGESGEDIAVHKVPMKKVHDWLDEKRRAGVMVDPKVYTGLYFLTRG